MQENKKIISWEGHKIDESWSKEELLGVVVECVHILEGLRVKESHRIRNAAK
jgi:hypothetical protein